MITALVAATNLILGAAYLGIGVMTAIDLKRGWKTMGFSHFGVAFMGLAFTCGPHHLAHGLHTAFEGRQGRPLDLSVVAVGLPFGVIWLLLRVEAFTGGRGDRFISGDPGWLKAMPSLAAAFLTAVIFGLAALPGETLVIQSTVLANLLLVGIYAMIGYFMLRTQLRNRPEQGGWSVSGLSLAGVFPTCAVMHLVWAAHLTTGAYAFDGHSFVIDRLAVPAGLYFLWVVRALYRDALRDWNDAGPVAARPRTFATETPGSRVP